jgi:hypothetical protein
MGSLSRHTSGVTGRSRWDSVGLLLRLKVAFYVGFFNLAISGRRLKSESKIARKIYPGQQIRDFNLGGVSIWNCT